MEGDPEAVKRIILDLCGGTGSWSKPYVEAGYDVRLVTLPDQDVRTYHPPAKVRGVLSAPPCTVFSIANNMRKQKRSASELLAGVEIVAHCLRIIVEAQPEWWALENPIGYLQERMGRAIYSYQPWQFGDPWTKRTMLWGRFAAPRKRPVKPLYAGVGAGGPSGSGGIRKATKPRSGKSQARAVTPSGFARAFFEANP